MPIMKPANISPAYNSTYTATEIINVTWQNFGDRQYAYQIKIYDNSNNALIYDTDRIISMNPSHIIPANTFPNGITLKMIIITENSKNETATSDWIIFRCNSVPIATFTNLSANDEILNSSYLFQGSYSQAEGVNIKSWNMLLYDNNDFIIGNSGVQYSETIEYQFEGLNNEDSYYIELQVRSQNDLIGTTGKISFNVRYEVPASSINLTAESVPEKAGVRLSWRTIQIIGQVIDGTILYIDNDKIDLRNGVIAFQEDMPNFKSFSLKSWIDWVDLENTEETISVPTCLGDVNQVIKHNKTEILRLKTELGDIWIEWIYDDVTSGRFHLWKDFYGEMYHIFTETISPIIGDNVYLGVNFDGNLFNIYTEILA